MLDTTPAAVSSALQRARAAVEQRLPASSQQTTLRMVGDAKLRAVVDRYVRAWEAGDVAAITAMLTAEATMAMPPMAAWYRGREAIGAFLADGPMARAGRWRHLPVAANGHAAVAVYEVTGAPSRRARDRAPDAGVQRRDQRRDGVHRPRAVRPLRTSARDRWIRALARI